MFLIWVYFYTTVPIYSWLIVLEATQAGNLKWFPCTGEWQPEQYHSAMACFAQERRLMQADQTSNTCMLNLSVFMTCNLPTRPCKEIKIRWNTAPLITCLPLDKEWARGTRSDCLCLELKPKGPLPLLSYYSLRFQGNPPARSQT